MTRRLKTARLSSTLLKQKELSPLRSIQIQSYCYSDNLGYFGYIILLNIVHINTIKAFSSVIIMSKNEITAIMEKLRNFAFCIRNTA